MTAEPADRSTADRDLPCPSCREAPHTLFMYRKHGCDIYRCSRCGLGRAETRGFDPESYYTGDYFSGKHADGYPDYRGAESILRREFAGTVKFIKGFRPAGRLLEIGCAYGFFLREAKRDFEVSGIELAGEAARSCQEAGLDVVNGVADEPTLARVGPVDVIVMLDVIEHLQSPHETLARCLRHLNPGGIVLITTGDFGSLSARLAGARWRLMTPPQHLWFFSEEAIRRMATAHGLTVEHLDHPWKFVPFSLITFQLRRMLGLPPGQSGGVSRVGLPINLFDAMRVVLRKP